MRHAGRSLAALSLVLAVVSLAGPPVACLLAAAFALVACSLGLEASRDRVWAVGALMLASAIVLTAEVRSMGARGGAALDSGTLNRDYEEFWGELRSTAAAAADEFRRAGVEPVDRTAPFEGLETVLRTRDPAGTNRRALLLLDADGAAVAWAGPGLLHESEPGNWPARGAWVEAGFSAGTFAWVERIEVAGATWRLVAGQSFPREELPVAIPSGIKVSWSLTSRTDGVAAGSPGNAVLAGAPQLLLQARDAPSLFVAGVRSGRDPRSLARRGAAAVLAMGLAAMALTGFQRRRILGGTVWSARASVIEPALHAGGALAGLGLAMDSPLTVAVIFGLAGAVVLANLAPAPGGRGSRPQRSGWRPLLRAGAVLAPFLAAWALPSSWQRLLESRYLMPDGPSLVARWGWGLVVLATLATAGAALRGGRRERGIANWHPPLAVALACGSCFLLDLGPLSWGVGALAAWWTVPLLAPARGESWGRVLAGVVAAFLLAGWLHRDFERRRLVEEAGSVLAGLAPPAADEMAALRGEIEGALADVDLGHLGPAPPDQLDSDDLAFTLWRRLPLAKRNAASALVVFLGDGRTSRFAFGIPLREGAIDRDSPVWREVALAPFADAGIEGEATIDGAEGERAHVRYWFLPQPGFRRESGILDDPRWRLLAAGSLAGRRRIEGLPADFAVQVIAQDGSILRTSGDAKPAGRSRRVWTRRDGGTTTVLSLPRLRAIDSWERCATTALTPLLGGSALVLLVGALALGRRSLRDVLVGLARSYSSRLLVAVVLIAVAPLLLLQVVATRSFENVAQRAQRQGAEGSLHAAQRVLSQYLATIEPGFSLDTVLDDQLLRWLAGVVDRDVNLYWGSRLYAASQSELFGTAILPRRIPGEVFRRVSLRGEPVVSRTNRAEGRAYEELYAPLRVGSGAAAPPLVLSLPLLALQEEAAAEAGALRRRTLLASTALLVLLFSVAVRLARNFTRPIRDLVTGTQRIARGAVSLEVHPQETELRLLAGAIDRMAHRIALGRDQILREKQLLDGVVEHIEAAIMLLDSEGRVLLANRAAREGVGVEVGVLLSQAVEGRAAWRPLLAVVESAPHEPTAPPSRPHTFRAPARAAGREPGGEGEREWTALVAPLAAAGEARRLLVLEDSTEILRAQRLEAWAEMARMIAHEIKNPLTPIRLATEHLREVREREPARLDEVFDRCTESILRQVEELRSIASEFSTYSQIPRMEMARRDLSEVLRETVEAYALAPAGAPVVRLAPLSSGRWAMVDARLLRRALRNLIENALRASSTRESEVEVELRGEGSMASIEILDRGPGVPPDSLDRIFEPYFSTHEGGTGLGLPIARRIAEAHGGRLRARLRPGGGLIVALTLPLLEESERRTEP